MAPTQLPALQFQDPLYLWLLVLPAGLGVLWLWQLARRRRDARAARHGRTTPVPERFTLAGGLSFQLCLLLAVAALTLALARPQALVPVTRSAGADFIILQDGSASMRVSDVAPDRWQRSVAWIRTFTELLGWQDQRVALALFAHRAAPQVRLTRDPNALFFFLDHLGDEPPFRLEDDTSWDTNIEEGIYWGVQMFERDAQLHGERLSAKAFIVLSDGQAWSGEVDDALQLARDRGIRVYTIGVGTTAGGLIPQLPAGPYDAPEAPSTRPSTGSRWARSRRRETAPTTSSASTAGRTSRSGFSATSSAAPRRPTARRRSPSSTGTCSPPRRGSSASAPCSSGSRPSSGGSSRRPPRSQCCCCAPEPTSGR